MSLPVPNVFPLYITPYPTNVLAILYIYKNYILLFIFYYKLYILILINHKNKFLNEHNIQ